MKINKSIKILVGILTLFVIFVPFLIPFVGIFFMFSFGFPFFDPYAVPNFTRIVNIFMPMVMVFYATMLCFSAVQLGLQIFYVIHEVKNEALTDTLRILFILGTFLLTCIALPVYYIAYLWKEKPAVETPAQPDP